MGQLLRTWAPVVLVGIGLFWVAAKHHGRQLRLEREHAGYHSVRFGGRNPPFVEALWRAERVRVWVPIGVLSVLWLAYLVAARVAVLPVPSASLLGNLSIGVLYAFCIAFVVGTVLGIQRTASAGGASFGAALASGALWWVLLLVLAAAHVWLVTRLPRT